MTHWIDAYLFSSNEHVLAVTDDWLNATTTADRITRSAESRPGISGHD